MSERRVFTIMVTGSREWADKAYVWRILDEIVARERSRDPDTFFRLLHGGARGVDEMAGAWANQRGITEEVVHAQWRRLGRRAGMIRNQWMIDMRPDFVAAFRLDGSPGTSDAIQRAQAAGIDLFIEDAVTRT